MTGDAAAYVLYFLTIRIELQLVILKNMTGESDLTLYNCYNWVLFLLNINFGLKYKVMVNLAVCTLACPGMYVRRCRDI